MILYYCYRKAFSTKKSRGGNILSTPYGWQYKEYKDKIVEMMKEAEMLPYEQVYTESYDGLKLAARYYHTSDGAPLEIMFHGYRSSAICDFSGGIAYAQSLGFNVLAVDERGHGLSEGKHLTFGVRERYDVISWVNWSKSRFGDVKIILDGVSMGASTVLLASGLDLPDNVVAILADSPYDTPRNIIKKVCRDMHLPPRLAYPFVHLAAKLYMKCNLDDADVCKAVKKSKVPLLIIHGDADAFVPHTMSEEIFKNCKEGDERVVFPGAGHVLSFLVDPERYKKCIKELIKKTGI